QTFDELLGDIIKQYETIPTEVVQRLEQHRSRVSGSPLLAPGVSWPVVRLNALPITDWPARCTRLVCNIGGDQDVRDAVEVSVALTVAVRSRGGVLAFGSDREVRKAFAPFEITDFAPFEIERGRIEFDSPERRLLHLALMRAIGRTRPITFDRRAA